MIQIHKENGWDDDAGQIIGWYYNFHYNYIARHLVLEILSAFFLICKTKPISHSSMWRREKK